ncbi:MAG: glutamate racemase [Muribaculum sp.]
MTQQTTVKGPIGVFDSGYGGLTILRDIMKTLPDYDYIYLGDNARAPYGGRSYDIVYRFTLQAVRYLFEQGCHLVILACNTASAKALRTIQQNDLPSIDPDRRVLGVIRPTVEKIGEITGNGNIGIVGTSGTVRSQSYDMEIKKLYPGFNIFSQACPMWAPLVENGEADKPGADYFVKRDIELLMSQEPSIDSIILGCTHYPLLLDKIERYVPEGTKVLSQGKIVANSLADYLERHPEMAARCSRGGECTYLTTENPEKFAEAASVFLSTPVTAQSVTLS